MSGEDTLCGTMVIFGLHLYLTAFTAFSSVTACSLVKYFKAAAASLEGTRSICRHRQVHKDDQDNHCQEKLRSLYQEILQVGDSLCMCTHLHVCPGVLIG